MKTWKQQLEQYGRLGLIVHFSIFGLTLIAMGALLKLGLAAELPYLKDHPEAQSGATIIAAYALTQLLKLPRLLLTLSLTPLIAKYTGKSPASEPS